MICVLTLLVILSCGVNALPPPVPFIDQVQKNCSEIIPQSALFGIFIDVAKDPSSDEFDAKLFNGRWFDVLGNFAHEMSRLLKPEQFCVAIMDGVSDVYYLSPVPLTTTTSTTTTTTTTTLTIPTLTTTTGIPETTVSGATTRKILTTRPPPTTRPRPSPPTTKPRPPPPINVRNMTITALDLYGKNIPASSYKNGVPENKAFSYVVVITDGSQKDHGASSYPAVPRLIVDVGGRWTTDVAKSSGAGYKASEVFITDNLGQLNSLRRTIRNQFCSLFPGSN